MTMKNSERSDLYRLLCLAEDYVLDGFRHDHPPVANRTDTPPAAESVGATAAPAAVARAAAAEDPSEALRGLAEQIRSCTICDLHRRRTLAVPGEGASRPTVIVVGEGPGFEEDRSGRPFVGPAGRYLDKWLQAIELDRGSDCFIANIVKCRPPGNRDPLPEESAACLPYLQRQIALLAPRAILSLGRIATQILTGRSAGIGELRAQRHTYQGIPLVGTYHPSAVLRNKALRKPVWEDLRLLQSVLADG